MKKILLTLLLSAVALYIAGGGRAEAQNNGGAENLVNLKNSKVLVAYFSHSGNTTTVAEQLHSMVGGELYQILTVEPYPQEYKAATEAAKKELKGDKRPALSGPTLDMTSYDLIFLGYPNWWGTMPMPLFSFLEQYDFSGKTIVPFSTHEGSRLGRSVDDLSRKAPRARLLKGFEIRGSRVDSVRPALQVWLRDIGLI